MKFDIIIYYLIASALFLIIIPFVKKKLMPKFTETESVRKQTKIAVAILLMLSVILGITVSKYFLVFTLFMSTGLIYYAMTGFCMLSIMLSKIPWNKVSELCAECKI